MERFVFVAAITVAVIFGIAAVFGDGDFKINFDDADAFGTAELVDVSPGAMTAAAFAGSSLRLRDVAARVTVIPEDRQDFEVQIDNSAGRAPMPTVTVTDGRVVVDGHLRGRIDDCRSDGGADLEDYGELTAEQLPLITIRAPRALDIDINGAGTTEIGATQSLSLDLSGCSSAILADVAAELDVDLAGSGSVRAGAARSINVDLAGSGDMIVGAVAEAAEIDVAGSGTITIASLSGDLNADAAGSGTIQVQGGEVRTAEIDLAGSADVNIAAPVRTLNVSIVGSGSVDVTNTVGDLEADVAGSGDVSVQAVTGSVHRQIYGSGEVRVGR